MYSQVTDSDHYFVGDPTLGNVSLVSRQSSFLLCTRGDTESQELLRLCLQLEPIDLLGIRI